MTRLPSALPGHFKRQFSLLLLLLLGSSGALAGPIQIDLNSVAGTWTDATPTQGTSGVGTNEIRWGRPPPGGAQSAYRFDGAAPPQQGPYGVEEEFDLGTFTHFNFPIYQPWLDSAILEVVFDFTLSNGQTQDLQLTSTFVFDHTETPNNPDPGDDCAEGGSRPCPDLVEVALNPSQSTSIEIDGGVYGFDITGFLVDNILLDSFLTFEDQENVATLRGKFTEISAPLVPPAQTPVPAPIALIGLGAVLIGLARRKRMS